MLLTDREQALVERLASRIVELRMATPAILFLESVRPLNYVGSQVMVFFAPVVRGFFGMPEWDEFRRILEHRESIGYLVDLIEAKENLILEEEAKSRAERKRAKAEAKAKAAGPQD
ncbi:MAG: hypothetical protein FJY67_11615 [Calditrichaeota bacterium]|nr:hypothetical protein [Calditrichota bacterium]